MAETAAQRYARDYGSVPVARKDRDLKYQTNARLLRIYADGLGSSAPYVDPDLAPR